MNPYQPPCPPKDPPGNPSEATSYAGYAKAAAIAAITGLLFFEAATFANSALNKHKQLRTSTSLTSYPVNVAEQKQEMQSKLKYLESILETIQRGDPDR